MIQPHFQIGTEYVLHRAALYGGTTSKIALVRDGIYAPLLGMTQYLPETAWETEVWMPGAPDHLIHFYGERLSGPQEIPK